jgi:hypothetical protein
MSKIIMTDIPEGYENYHESILLVVQALEGSSEELEDAVEYMIEAVLTPDACHAFSINHPKLGEAAYCLRRAHGHQELKPAVEHFFAMLRECARPQ